jgi:tRNA A37 N6-isopentenylltransferase MiaA
VDADGRELILMKEIVDHTGRQFQLMMPRSPESPLKKKHVAICYHRCREDLAAGFIQLAKEDMKTNLADAFMKLLPGPRRKELLGRVLD